MPIELIKVGETKEVEIGGGIVVLRRLDQAEWMRLVSDLSVMVPESDEDTGILKEWGGFCDILAKCIVSIDGVTEGMASVMKRIADLQVVLELQNAIYEFNQPDGGPEGNSPSSLDGSSGETQSQTAGTVTTNDEESDA